MKKQETVEKNFQKTLQQWEASRNRKISNLKEQNDLILKKHQALKDQYEANLRQIEKIKSENPPLPPSVEIRNQQRERNSGSQANSSQSSQVSQVSAF